MDYFAYKADISGKVGNDRDWPRWRSSVRSAVTFLLEDSITVKRSKGLLGYSQGSLLAISVASSIPQVKGVVEFFGSGGSDKEELKSNIKNFPPLLILHGEADQGVPVSHAYALRDAVMAQAGEVEIKIYPGATHGFNASWFPNNNEAYANDSFHRMIDFFRRKL